MTVILTRTSVIDDGDYKAIVPDWSIRDRFNVKSDLRDGERVCTIDIKDLNDLKLFAELIEQDLVIERVWNDSSPLEIEIYDDWRE